MISDVDYALMAGRAYESTRKAINWFPIPDGWQEFFHVPEPTIPGFPATSGFEAVSFFNGPDVAHSTEIVISFAGTYDKDITGDIAADIGLATGFGSAQLLQAAEYYLQVKAANASNPNATITLTGLPHYRPKESAGQDVRQRHLQPVPAFHLTGRRESFI